MKKIPVIIKDQYTLELKEDAIKGDIIDLTLLNEVDFDVIIHKIDEGKDQVYNNKLGLVRSNLLLENKNKLIEETQALKMKISSLEQKLKSDELDRKKTIDLELANQSKGYQVEINNLKNEVVNNNKLHELKLKELNDKNNNQNTILSSKYLLEIEQLKQTYNDKLNSLTSELKIITDNKDNTLTAELSKLTLVLESKHNEVLDKLKESYRNQLQIKDEEITKLNFQKSVKNIKQTGENLEVWCDEEIKSYMQNGFYNCTWKKDNQVILEDGESKGSKADFIFNIFSSDECKNADLLTSVCLEMKDENPDSITRKKNADYFKQLDKNRTKKNCKYALLVSNLELDNSNQSPMYKVREYEDMYVVRPAYLMTFLNILVSMNTKFKELLLNVKKERLELITSIELTEQFEKLKNSYLDKPLELLAKEIDVIKKNVDTIEKSAKAINASCDKVVEKYIEDISNKLSKFNIRKINKVLDTL